MTEQLNDRDAENFGNDQAAKEGASGGYVANFSGDEINGKLYQLGDRIADDVDPGTLAYLTQIGRISPVADPADGPSGGEGQTGLSGGGDEIDPALSAEEQAGGDEIDPALSAEEQADADALVRDNTKDALLQLAADEKVANVSGDDNKAEIAARIIAGRRA